MATLNDFKYVSIKSKKMFSYIPDIKKDITDETMKARLGFYHLILEKITGITDAADVQNLIQDTEYLTLLGENKGDDLGIDAIYINEELSPEKEILLFNFKYREKFSAEKTTSGNSLPISTKFLQYIPDDALIPSHQNVNAKTIEHINKIKECLASNSIYNIKLYFITNESNGFANNLDDIIKNFEKNYGMEVKSISLDEIISFLDLNREDIEAKTMVNANDLLTYSRDDKTTEKSYICKMSLFDLIRLTSNDANIRKQYNMEDDNDINMCNLDYSVLYDNVRGYLGQTSYNKNIVRTLEKEPSNFFMFNNGITITCKQLDSTLKSGNTKYLLSLSGFQIVNGGQTLRAAYNYLKMSTNPNKIVNLRIANILVRIFKISTDQKLKNNIAEYTNSQNAISPIDLKSVDMVQIDLEKYLREQNILYIRKTGDVGSAESQYEYRISMEKFTQILHAKQGYPERVSNLKKKLFTDWYDEIYSDGKFEISQAGQLIKIYFEIEEFYKTNSIKKYDQKIYYMVFIITNYKLGIVAANGYLSQALSTFPSKLTESRVMLKSEFKEFLVNTIENLPITK
ncbi:AIPR family protein [Chryseobacterium sp.]|uniref:AIPR family protein n=1 Tax=Chryseobacterium sp. TaxID=1871047 RepID=UPI002FC6F26E